ncbi:hypothetical protein HC928_00375 [bacterium]|nr:hypothetical protein [bacterium]
MVEFGGKSFDMKPGFLANAQTSMKSPKRKIPRALAASMGQGIGATRFRIIPLNVNRYINMNKPKVFRTVTDKSPPSSWIHPGLKGVRIMDTVVKELETKIIPKHMKTLLGDDYGS